MKNKLPIRNLLRLSWCFSLVISFFLLITAFMEGEILYGALNRSLMFLLLSMLISIGNIGLLILLQRKDGTKTRKYTFLFYFASIIMSTILILGIYKFHRFLVDHRIITVPPTPLRVKGSIIYLYMSFQGILMNGILLLLHNFVIVQDANNKAQLENSRLNTARSEAAYKLLLQQIHPHFLFNALNILKSLIKKSPEKAEDYLVRLSDFLRVSISGDKRGVATLQDEVKLCIDYLEMQKVRFGNALSFSFDIQEENNPHKVLPVFSLQPLLENVIKHNELTESAPLNIQVRQVGEWISVINNIQLKSLLEYSTGSGLANLSERYKLLSGDEVEIHNNGIIFSVSLKILNDEDRNHRR